MHLLALLLLLGSRLTISPLLLLSVRLVHGRNDDVVCGWSVKHEPRFLKPTLALRRRFEFKIMLHRFLVFQVTKIMRHRARPGNNGFVELKEGKKKNKDGGVIEKVLCHYSKISQV